VVLRCVISAAGNQRNEASDVEFYKIFALKYFMKYF